MEPRAHRRLHSSAYGPAHERMGALHYKQLEEFNINSVEVLHALYFLFQHNAQGFGNVSLVLGNDLGLRLL